MACRTRDIGGANNYYPYDSFHVTPNNTGNSGFHDNIPGFAFFSTGEYNTADYVQTPLPDKQQIYSLTLTQDVKIATLTATGSFYKRNFGFFRDNTWAVISLGLGPGAAGRPQLLQLPVQTTPRKDSAGNVILNSGFLYSGRPVSGADQPDPGHHPEERRNPLNSNGDGAGGLAGRLLLPRSRLELSERLTGGGFRDRAAISRHIPADRLFHLAGSWNYGLPTLCPGALQRADDQGACRVW